MGCNQSNVRIRIDRLSIETPILGAYRYGHVIVYIFQRPALTH